MMLTTLVRASLEGAVLVAAIWMLARAWPRVPPAVLAALWWCGAAKFLLGLVWTVPIELRVLPASAIRPATTIVNVSGEASRPASSPAVAGMLTAPEDRWQTMVLGLWLLGATITVGAGIRRWRRTHALLRSAAGAPAELEAVTRDVAFTLRLRRVPEVRVSPHVLTPLVSGVVRPIVVVPERFFELSNPAQRMALCHELAHVKRADLLLGIVPALAERLFFFHPLARLAAREYALWREAACDEAVMRTLASSPQDYGRLLLALGVAPGRTAAAAGAPWSFSTLKRRVTMLREPSRRSLAARAGAAVAIAAAALAIVPLRLTARPAAVQTPAAAAEQAAAIEQAGARSDSPSYVLFLEGDITNMSGSTDDLRRARQFRRNGERLLWFRHASGEYLVRDRAVLDQVDEIWTPVGAFGEAQGQIGRRQGEIGARQGEIGAAQGRVGAEQAQVAGKQAVVAGRMSRVAARQHAVRTDADQRALDAEMRRVDEEMRVLDREMQALDIKMREAGAPMAVLDSQMRELDGEMRALDQKMEEASHRARQQMIELLDRAIASGAAIPAR